jgi:hypothetical protein
MFKSCATWLNIDLAEFEYAGCAYGHIMDDDGGEENTAC